MQTIFLRWRLACWLILAVPLWVPATVQAAPTRILEQVDVGPCWSGHPVGFALLTRGDRQFVAFYDAQRRMTVGVRTLDSSQWDFVRLDETLDWDSHNYVTLGVDDAGGLHLSGNMHASPLIYFRSTRPLDIHSFQRVRSMVDAAQEARASYPWFFRGPDNAFLFSYRDGMSGNGVQFYNRYDQSNGTWRRLLATPLADGEGKNSTYITGPVRGPDGFLHIAFVWRGQNGAELNHDLSYARSRDLVSWERSDGTPVVLPITLGRAEIVDPIPMRAGLINGNVQLGFDSLRRPVITYQKYDAAGNLQIYSARREASGWVIRPMSAWDYRWDFGGFGSIEFEVKLGGLGRTADGHLTQQFWHKKYGAGMWILDEATLAPLRIEPQPEVHPAALQTTESDFPGMEVRWATDLAQEPASPFTYVLRWETLAENRDQPRAGEPPPATMLRLYKLSRPD